MDQVDKLIERLLGEQHEQELKVHTALNALTVISRHVSAIKNILREVEASGKLDVDLQELPQFVQHVQEIEHWSKVMKGDVPSGYKGWTRRAGRIG